MRRPCPAVSSRCSRWPGRSCPSRGCCSSTRPRWASRRAPRRTSTTRSGACASTPTSRWSWSSRTPTWPSASSTAPPSWRPDGTCSPARPPSSGAWTRSVALTWEAEMGKFVQLVVDGLSTGSIYGAIALAIVLVNQATGLINFAQGGMAVLAAYVAWWLTTHDVPLVLAILVSILFSFVLGAVVERWLMRRFERGDPDTAVVVTIGLLTLITGFCGWVWTYNNH